MHLKQITTIFLMAGTMSACNDQLNLTPFSQANAEDFYQDADDFENAVNATYDALQDSRLYASEFEFLLEVHSDNGQYNDPATESGEPYSLDKFTVTSSNSYVSDAYSALYEGVERANAVIATIDDVEFDDGAQQNQFKGESLFLRALFYYHLVQLFGDVPLITDDITVEEARSLVRDPEAEVWVQIEEDLINATALLPTSYDESETGRATAWSAYGLLAKVYLTEQNYSAAKTALNTLIASGEFALLSSISEVFSTSNEYNEEIVFAVRFLKGEGGEGHGLLFGYSQNPTINEDLQDAYEAADERLELVTYTASTGGALVPGKYYDVLSESSNVGNDIPVLRYADVLLMYAEVLNELQYTAEEEGDAFTALNAVHTRAGLDAYTVTDLPNQLTFRNAVYLERRLELALEFQRWYDLKRTDTAISTLALRGISVETCQLLYPIPQTEIDIYNDATQFPQNDCY